MITPHGRAGAANVRRAWFIGGCLLIASVLFTPLFAPIAWLIPGFGFVSAALVTASLLVFAIGIRGAGSITARRPLGTSALVCLGIVILVSEVVSAALASSAPELLMATARVSLLVQGAAALTAVVQIGRVRMIPSPWNWAPAWLLGMVVAVELLSQAPTSIGVPVDATSAAVLSSLEGLTRIVSALFLGVLAIVLAAKSTRTRTVEIMSSR